MDHSLLTNNLFSRENQVQSHEKIHPWSQDGKADLSPVPSDSPKPGDWEHRLGDLGQRALLCSERHGKKPGFEQLNLSI